jgi:hypothetical protein
MTNDDIAHLRLLAEWHDRQARYLLLTVPGGQHDEGRFHSMAAARLSRLADEITMSRSGGEDARGRDGRVREELAAAGGQRKAPVGRGLRLGQSETLEVSCLTFHPNA